MNGQMKKYKEILKTMPEPVPLSQVPKSNFDFRKMVKYAEAKEVQVINLSEDEKKQFIRL